MRDKTILLKTNTIGSAVTMCEPIMIAVAYVGIDWGNFIDASKVEKIIVSPTIGSNPYAIEELVKLISWDKIFFLDSLHAKIYIGKENAILGSSNLSRNGLSIAGLEEAAVQINDKSIIIELTKYFGELESLAVAQYPEIENKKKKLLALKRDWAKAVRGSVIKENTQASMSLQQFSPLSNDDFYIAWYHPFDNYDYTDQANSIKYFIEDEMHLAEDDEVEKGKWILSWRLTSKNRPHKKVKPSWIFIDELISNGVSSEEAYDYTKLAIMRNDKPKTPPPFEINNEVAKAFNDTICKDKFGPYFIGGNEPFLIKDTFIVFKDFVNEMKKKIIT
ncbi:MAG: phospholipase D family protein [Pseudomonadota bacterium]